MRTKLLGVRMGAKKKDDRVGLQHLRFEPDLVARIDAHRDRLAAQYPGMTVTRTSTIRTLLLERLAQVEGDPAK